MKIRSIGAALSLSIASVLFSGAASAQGGPHPHYTAALANLRTARWLIEHRPGNWAQFDDEKAAERQINDAIREIKEAHLDDGKGMDDHIAFKEHMDHGGRLHDAMDYLRHAKDELLMADPRYANGLRDREIHHADEAMRLVGSAIRANHY